MSRGTFASRPLLSTNHECPTTGGVHEARGTCSSLFTVSNGRSVWLFTRPAGTGRIPIVVSALDGKHHLCHWGILITELSVVDAKAIIFRTRPQSEDIELGTMFELSRDFQDLNTVSVTAPFTIAMAREKWRPFSAMIIGETAMTDAEIESEGIIPRDGARFADHSDPHYRATAKL